MLSNIPFNSDYIIEPMEQSEGMIYDTFKRNIHDTITVNIPNTDSQIMSFNDGIIMIKTPNPMGSSVPLYSLVKKATE